MPFQRWISVSVNKRLYFILKQSLSGTYPIIDRRAELSNLFKTKNEWACFYNDTVIIIKHISTDFKSLWISAWLCTNCQQVNCRLCLWQNCDSSGRQSVFQSDALRLNAHSFIPRSNHNFKFKEWPTSFVSCPQLILDKSSSTFNA